jgi:hypothetical protein
LLPKPKYEREELRERSSSYERKVAYNTNNEEKDLIAEVHKKRIQSSFEESQKGSTIEKSIKRERTISSYNPSNILLLNERLPTL